MSKSYLLYFLFGVLFSFNTLSATKQYLVVLKRPIPLTYQKGNPLVTSGSSQLKKKGVSDVFGNDKISHVSLFSQYVRGVSPTGIGPLNNDSKEEYTYLIHLDDTYIHDFLSQVKALDEYVHVQQNFTYTTFTGNLSQNITQNKKRVMNL